MKSKSASGEIKQKSTILLDEDFEKNGFQKEVEYPTYTLYTLKKSPLKKFELVYYKSEKLAMWLIIYETMLPNPIWNSKLSIPLIKILEEGDLDFILKRNMDLNVFI